MTKPFLHVAAGLILRPDGALLLGQRPADKPWPGWWELPGGKLEPAETVMQALARELKEELDIEVTEATPWVTYVHEYPKNIVKLMFCRVTGWHGEPRGMENQAFAWVDPHATLSVGPLLPAAEPPLRWLRLPDQYLISSIESAAGLPQFLEQRLGPALDAGVRLVQLREPGWLHGTEDPALRQVFELVIKRCHQVGARCLINSAHPVSWWALADGVHLRAADAVAWAERLHLLPVHGHAAGPYYGHPDPHPALGLKPGQLLGVSAHTVNDLAAARCLNASFAMVGHVLETPSHPGQPGLGWDAFARLNEQAGLPVFAVGGQSRATLPVARQHGAHGIAVMRAGWANS